MKTKTLLAIARELKSKTLPILDFTLLDRTYLTMTDLQIYVKVKHGLPVLSDTVLVETSQFLKRLAVISSPFKIEQETNVVRITMPSSETVLQSTDGDYPPLPKREAKKAIGTLNEGDINIMARSVKFTADDDLPPTMKCVFIDNDKIVASNAHMMIYTTVPDKGFQLSVPKEVVRLMKLLPGSYDIYRDTKHLFAESADAIICWRNEDINYPKWQSVIPEQSGSVVIPVNETIMALQRVAITMNIHTHSVIVTIGGDTMSLQTKDMDYFISSTESVPIINSSECKIKVGIKHNFIMQILRELQSEGICQIEMKFTDATHSITFADRFLLMPMIINE